MREFIIHKGITVPIVAQNVDAHQMVIMNSLLTMVVLRIGIYTTPHLNVIQLISMLMDIVSDKKSPLFFKKPLEKTIVEHI